MAKLTTDELLDAFKEMTLIELSEFVKQFEDTFGVTAAAPVAVAAAPGAGAAGGDAGAAEEKDEFEVVLEAAGDKKINVIKEVRALTSLGLKEAKELVEAAPKAVLEKVTKEAADKLAELDRWTDIKSAMPLLEERIGHSLAEYDLDGPLPDLPISDQLRSRAELLTALARREDLTIRQLALRVAAGRGHHIVLGTPVEIADRMQQWFDSRAADGFNVMPPFFPGGLEDFTQLVVPILQERGLFRREYGGPTLRDHLGLTRPAPISP